MNQKAICRRREGTIWDGLRWCLDSGALQPRSEEKEKKEEEDGSTGREREREITEHKIKEGMELRGNVGETRNGVIEILRTMVSR